MTDLTRRELLTAFLGAPLALAACARGTSRDRPPLPPGEVVGPSAELGHKIRDGFRVEPSADAWTNVAVAIVGGGAAGLAAAWRLERAGLRDYCILELEEEPGGTARFGESPVVRYPWGAHYIPAPLKEDRALIALLGDMGVLEGADASGEPIVGEQFLCRDPEERVFYRGRWYEGLYLRAGASADDLAQLERFNAECAKLTAWRDAKGRRAFAIPVSASSSDSLVTSLDRMSMAEWLDAGGFTSPRLRWFVEYACRDDYGAKLAKTSAWAGLFYFCSRVGEAGGESQPLLTWPEGNGRIVGHLAGVAGSRLRTGCAALDVRPTGAGVDVVGFDTRAGKPFGLRSRRVVFAAPRFLATRIVAPLRDHPPDFLRSFEYGSWVVANVHLRDRPATRPQNFPECWDNVLYESPSLGYVVATHQTELDRGPTVFTWYYPICEDDVGAARGRLLAASRDEWAEAALSDLEAAHGEIRSLAERVDIMKWGHAMVTPKPGLIWSGARELASERLEGIHFAHTDLSGVALFEEALHHGVRAAEEILADLAPLTLGESLL